MTSPQTPLHTSPRTELTTTSTTGQRDDDVTTVALPQPRRALGLTFTQVAGSSLAAVSSALAASFLGVAGTISGALVGSLIGTVGTALYAHSLHTAGTRMRTLAPVAKRRPTETSGHPSTEPLEVHGPIRDDGAQRIRWRPVAAIGAGVAAAFIIALGAITMAEKVLGHPVSSASGGGTTIGRAVTSEQQNTTPTPTATTPATATATTPTTAVTTTPASPTATTATTSPSTASASTSTTPASPIPSPTAPATP